jgi:hypothetical protein
MKVIIYKHDPMLSLVRTREDILAGWDVEDFEEQAIEIPDQLALDIQTTYKKLLELSKQVAEYKEKHEDLVSKRLCRKCGKWKTGVVGELEHRRCPDCAR